MCLCVSVYVFVCMCLCVSLSLLRFMDTSFHTVVVVMISHDVVYTLKTLQ